MSASRITLPTGLTQAAITTFILPLAYGNPDDDMDGSNERFRKATFEISHRSALVIQTAGYGKESPLKPAASARVALCDLMLARLKRKNQVWADRFISSIRGWGTRSEVREFFNIIRELSITPQTHPRLRIIICSNRAHLRRVKWYVNLYNLEGWEIEYREADHPFTAQESLREIVALGIEILREIFHPIGKWRKVKAAARQVRTQPQTS